MAAGGSEIILSIRDVSKSFPGVKALDRVSIDFRRGTVHGIVGRERRGQVDPDEDPVRRLPEGQRDDRVRRRARRAHHPAPVDAERAGDHLPGAQPRQHDERRGERLPRPLQGNEGHAGHPRKGAGAPGQHRLQGAHDAAGFRALRVGEADGGDRQGALLQLEAHHHGRAELEPHRRRRWPSWSRSSTSSRRRGSRSSTSATSWTRSSSSATS